MADFTHVKLTGRAVIIAMILNLTICIAEFIGGLIGNSLALLSDALHNLSDLIALFIAYIAIRLSMKPPTKRSTYGHVRAEVISAFVNALTLIAVGIFILYEAGQRLLDPHRVEGNLVIIFGFLGLVANTLAFLILKPSAKHDLNAKAAFLHLVTDAGESFAVVLGGILIMFGVPLVDPILSMFIGIFTIKGAWDVVKSSANILNEGAPEGIDSEDIIRCLTNIEGVIDVHHVHIWCLSSNYKAISAHVVVPDQMVSDSQRLIHRMQETLKERFDISHPTFQIEANECLCKDH